MSSGNNSANEVPDGEVALLEVIANGKASDPLIGAKVAGKEVLHRLIRAMTNEKGVQVESLFTALGALAGFSCQMASDRSAKIEISKSCLLSS
jgi:hypothetical protein